MIEKKIVSVVVPAFNCEKTISKTIQSVLDQSYGDLEIIIVDDGSTDSTAKIITSMINQMIASSGMKPCLDTSAGGGFISDFKSVKYFYQKNSGPAAARNLGAKRSKGEFIFFTDSDCIAHFDWIEKAMKCFCEDIAVVAGSYGIANHGNLLATCVFKEIRYRHTKLMPKYPKAFGSYNFGVKKNVFDEVGGFNTSYRSASGEDNDLSYKILRAGYRIYFEKDALVDHYHPQKVWKYLKEQYRHGYWRVKMYSDHPKMAKGDDYTFWKDIVEIPMAFVSVVSLVASLFIKTLFFKIALLLIILLLAIELSFSFVIIQDVFGAIFMSLVMFLRSFARMIGFTTGIFSFFLQNFLQKR